MIRIRVAPGSFGGFRKKNWWQPTQKEWAPILLQENRALWPSEADPTTNRAWENLSARYRAWKIAHVGNLPILMYSGRMLSSAEVKPYQSGFSVKSTPYGKYHQFGTSRMASRPWMGLPQTAMEHLPGIAWKHILPK